MSLIESGKYWIPILATVLSFSTATASALNCRATVGQVFYTRDTVNKKIDHTNFISYLGEKNRKDIFGLVETQFSDRFDTRFYFTGTAPGTNLKSSFQIDPNAKAVYVFFHGSGTAQSSGKNFYGIMNTLAKIGFSAVSFDKPFHANGPLSPKFNDADYFINWLKSIIDEVKLSGKPVYLVGHSFGPDVMAELTARFPFLVDGMVALSPAGFNKTLSDWYQNYTAKMKFGGEVPVNEAGGQWAGTVGSQFQWSKGTLKDPTIVNPNLKVLMLSGDREEYVPAPVGGSKKTPIGPNTYDIGKAFQEHFKNAEVKIEKGIGHYIFNHVDAEGHNVVMKQILQVSGHDIKSVKKYVDDYTLHAGKLPYTERAISKYAFDGNFRSWINRYVGEKVFRNKMNFGNEFLAKNLFDQYDLFAKDYEAKIAEFIIGNNPLLADFQKGNANAVEQARKSFKDRASTVLTAFNAYVERLPEEKKAEILNAFNYQFPEAIINLKKE